MRVLKETMYGLLLGAVLLTGCRREFVRPSLENELLVPILNAKLSINEIVPDSLQELDNEGFVTLVFRNNLYSAALNSFDPLETREFEQTARLQSLNLGVRSVVREISLGEVCEGAGIAGAIIISQNGETEPIPNLTGLSFGPINVDGTALFETVTLDSGQMDITLRNNFPTGLSNINFEVRNDDAGNTLVGNGSFSSLPAGQTQTRTIDLAGKTINGNLLGNILNYEIDGTNGQAVLIDTAQVIVVTITVRDAKVNQATAVFPKQDVITLADTSGMQNIGDLRLTKATAKKGKVEVRVVSTIEDSMFFNYTIPQGIKNGSRFEVNEVVPPAPSGGSIERTFQYQVDGYTFDLTGMPLVNHYNAFYSELKGRIDSTGQLVSLSLEDSLLVYVKLSGFEPEYVKGYAGHSTVESGLQEVPISIFNKIGGGQIDFEQISVSVGVQNENGVPFAVELQSLTASNTKTAKSENLDLSALGLPLTIEPASALGVPWENNWNLDENQSNLSKVLNIFPNRISVEMAITGNPAQNNNNFVQFATDTSSLEAFVDITLPLSIMADQLIMADTVDIDLKKLGTADQVHDGILYLTINNTFPLGAEVELDFLDREMDVLESVIFEQSIAPGLRAVPSESTLEWPFTRDAFDRLLQSEKLVMRVVTSSEGADHHKIYSDQGLQITLSGHFNYLIE